MTTITELKKLLFSMILKTPIWLVHLAANQSSVMSIPIIQDQTVLHVIFPTLKALALNLSFSQVANSGILYLIAYNVSLINLFLRK